MNANMDDNEYNLDKRGQCECEIKSKMMLDTEENVHAMVFVRRGMVVVVGVQRMIDETDERADEPEAALGERTT